MCALWYFWPFIQFMRFSQQVYWGGLPFPPLVDHVLSELCAMTHPSWVALLIMAHSFIELCKPLRHDKVVILEGDCSHNIRRWLLLSRKAMTNLDSILKSRDIALPTKIPIVKAMVLPLVMYGCESWTIKKAEELMPSNCGTGEDSWKSLQQWGDQTGQSHGRSTLNIHWKDWYWSWSSSILIIWYEQMSHWKSPWCWERLRAEGEEGIRGWDGCTVPPKQWIQTWARECECELWEMVRDREAWRATVHGVIKSWTQLGDWTKAVIILSEYVWKHFRWQLSFTLTVVDGPARWAKKWATRQVILSSYKQRSTFIKLHLKPRLFQGTWKPEP